VNRDGGLKVAFSLTPALSRWDRAGVRENDHVAIAAPFYRTVRVTEIKELGVFAFGRLAAIFRAA
jgi:hypothetical protein